VSLLASLPMQSLSGWPVHSRQDRTLRVGLALGMRLEVSAVDLRDNLRLIGDSLSECQPWTR
jgi:hypothetical protein